MFVENRNSRDWNVKRAQAKNSKLFIENNYFLGKGFRNISFYELNLTGRRFILWLLSYELNFEYRKPDYYFRHAKKLQILFSLPGWMLLLPDSKGIMKKKLINNLPKQANALKTELNKEKVILSMIQAYTLNKAYKNFLWAL